MSVPNQRLLMIVIITGLTVTAGCMNSNGSPATSVPTSQATAENDAPTTSPSTTTAGYTFSQGERYTYTLVKQNRTFAWEVTDVSGDRVTARFRADSTDGETTRRTYTGTQATLFENSTVPVFGVLYNVSSTTHGQSLEVGHTWTVSQESLPRLFGANWETATAKVTGTGTINDISYYNVTITPGSDLDYSVTFRVNKNYPFALGWTSTGTATAIDTGTLVIKSVDR